MVNLLEYYKYMRAIGISSETHAFIFIAESQSFQIRSVTIELDQFDPYGYDPNKFGLSEEGISIEDISKHAA